MIPAAAKELACLRAELDYTYAADPEMLHWIEQSWPMIVRMIADDPEAVRDLLWRRRRRKLQS